MPCNSITSLYKRKIFLNIATIHRFFLCKRGSIFNKLRYKLLAITRTRVKTLDTFKASGRQQNEGRLYWLYWLEICVHDVHETRNDHANDYAGCVSACGRRAGSRGNWSPQLISLSFFFMLTGMTDLAAPLLYVYEGNEKKVCMRATRRVYLHFDHPLNYYDRKQLSELYIFFIFFIVFAGAGVLDIRQGYGTICKWTHNTTTQHTLHTTNWNKRLKNCLLYVTHAYSFSLYHSLQCGNKSISATNSTHNTYNEA